MASNVSAEAAIHLAGRAALIADDRGMRRENASAQARSTKEIEADRILREIRAKEAETIWRENHPDIKHPFPGMEFLTGKHFQLCID